MTQKVQMILLGAVIACLAIGLAASVAIRNDYFGRATSSKVEQGKSKFASELAEELNGVLPKKVATTTQPTGLAELTPATCVQAGGTWNECGSLCRGKSADTVCAQVCVPQCECSAGKGCPEGYACISGVPSGEGVCRNAQGQNNERTGFVDFPKEMKSADGVTSVVVEGMGNTGIYPPTLINPFRFSGTSTAFENVISWNVRQADGKSVASGTAYVHSPDVGQPGGFEVKAFFDAIPTMATGTLEVYEASAKDGSPIHAVSVPVIFPETEMSVTVFWGNSKKNPGSIDCTKVFPVAHKVAAYSIKGGALEVALHELLKGPTKWERSQGYYTSLPVGVADPKLTTSGLEFGEDLQQGVGGSCRVAAIRAQIIETYKRSTGTDNNPIISIDGRTEDILQP